MEAWRNAKHGRDSVLLNGALRSALAECCKLALHVTTVDIPYWNIVVDKHGAKLTRTVPGAIKPVPGKTDAVGEGICIHEGDQRHFAGVTLQEFAATLMRLTGEGPIQDKTGLTGRFDFTLPWYDYSRFPTTEIPDPVERMPLNSFGLKLQRGTGPGFIFNIDHIEKPGSN